jgi:hypothetical protein
MAQLLKHYFINRETNSFALNTKFGLMLPDIKGLEIIHRLTDESDIPYCLSTCTEYFEYSETVSGERLQELQNDTNVTVVSSSEVSVNGETLHSVVYQRAYVLEQTEGLSVITQQEWDAEVSTYDAKQLEKRIVILRSIRDEILSSSDWVVVKSTETGVALSTEFKDWRQSLRDLPDLENFPVELPTIPEEVIPEDPDPSTPKLPTEIQNDSKVLSAYKRWNEVTSIPMINDPVPPTDPVV